MFFFVLIDVCHTLTLALALWCGIDNKCTVLTYISHCIEDLIDMPQKKPAGESRALGVPGNEFIYRAKNH